MKPQLVVLTAFLLFLVLDISAQNPAYTVGDTAVAARLLQKSIELNGKKNYDEAYAKADSAQAIYSKILGSEAKEVADVLHQKGNSLYLNKKLNDAIDNYKKSLTFRLNILGETHPDVMKSYTSLSNSYYAKREYDKSIEYRHKALNIRLKLPDSLTPYLTEYYANLGLSYDANGDYDKAIEYVQNALNIDLKTFGEENADVAWDYNTLGTSYNNKKDFDKALGYFLKSLTIRLKIFDTLHLDVAKSYNGIGSVYFNKTECDRAVEYYEKAISIYRKKFGENSIYESGIYSKMGIGLNINGKYDKAIECYEKALKIDLKAFGVDNADVAIIYNNLGDVCKNKGFYDRSLEYHNKALDIRLRIFTSPHGHIAFSYFNLGLVYAHKGEYDKAIDYHQKALDIRLSLYGTENSYVSASFHGLGNSFLHKGDYQKALECFTKSLKIDLKISGIISDDVASTYNSIGLAYSNSHGDDKSILYFQKALDIWIKVLGSSHPNIADIYLSIGSIYVRKKENEKAIESCQKGLDIWLKTFGSTHPNIALGYNVLASAYTSKKDFDKSLENYQKALNIQLQMLDTDHNAVANTYANMGATYGSKEQYNKAIEYYEKALTIKTKAFGSIHPEITVLNRNLAFAKKKTNKGVHDIDLHYYKALKALNFSTIDSLNQVNSLPELINTLSDKADFERTQYLNNPNNSLNLYQATRTYQQAIDVINYQNKALDTEGSKAQLKNETYPVYEGAIKTKRLLYDLDKNDTLLHAAFSYAEQSKAKLLQAQIKESDALKYANIPDSLLQKEYNLRVDITWRTKQQQDKINEKKSETDSTVLAISSKIFDLRQQYDSLKTMFEKKYPEYYRLKFDFNTITVQEVQQKLLSPDQTLLEYVVGDSSIFIFTINQKDFNLVEVKKDFNLDSLVRLMREGIVGYHTAEIKTDTLRKAAPSAYTEGASLLYQKLIEPVKNQLKQQVIVIPDGILGYIPFEALIAKKSDKGRFTEHHYLLDSHRISYCYSATLLKEMIEKKHKKEPPYYLVAMAPYSTNDTTTLVDDLFVGTRKKLKPLKSSGQEVVNITTLMRGNPYYGKTAVESEFTRIAPKYRLIHLATHGEANDQSGNYSFLAFSEIKDSIENELLYVNELYNLSLNADMVVLSACETGIGQLQRGEGIVSLARAFSYAGAKSIVTSLWQVDDEKTKRLMIDFYKNLHKGLPKDEALWQAKRDFIKKTESDPYFWAGFIGIGDMRAIKN